MATDSDPWTYQCGKCGKDFKTKAYKLEVFALPFITIFLVISDDPSFHLCKKYRAYQVLARTGTMGAMVPLLIMAFELPNFTCFCSQK